MVGNAVDTIVESSAASIMASTNPPKTTTNCCLSIVGGAAMRGCAMCFKRPGLSGARKAAGAAGNLASRHVAPDGLIPSKEWAREALPAAHPPELAVRRARHGESHAIIKQGRSDTGA